MRPAFLLAALMTTASANAQDDAAWRRLPLVENGKVAPGWKFLGFGGFDIVDGGLRTIGDERGLGLLVYEKEKFGDCQIRLVFRTEKPESNAGVYVRIDDGILDPGIPPAAKRDAQGQLTDAGLKAMEEASEKALGPWYAVHHGYEVQICDVGDPLHRTGAIYSLAKSAAAEKPVPGKWRTMVITLRGDEVIVEVDGKEASRFNSKSSDVPARKIWHEPKREPTRPRVGYIGLQTHDPGDVVDYKEVSVRPLDDAR